jgi:membrane protein YdbS with pleckstrin-like domain
MYGEETFEAMGPMPTMASGEHILWRGKPSKRAYVADKALAMLPIAVIWTIFDLNFLRLSGGNGFLLMFLAVHMFPVWLWLGSAVTSVIQWRNEDYYLTNKRVIIRRGIFRQESQSVFLRDVHSIRTHYGLLDRLFGSGDIYINYSVYGHGKHRRTNGYFLMNLAEPEQLRERIELLALENGGSREEIY